MKKFFVYIAGFIVNFVPMPQRLKDVVMWPIASRLLGLSYRQIVRLKEGFFMYGGMDDILLREILFLSRWRKHIWEPKTSRKLENLAKTSKEILVAGSHVGYMVLKAAHHTRGRVHAFEPVPTLFSVSTKNIALNPEIKSRILITQFALGESVGEIKLYAEEIRSSAIPYSGGHRKENQITASMTTIDEYARSKNIRFDLILLDIEGFEWFALQGAEKTLSHRPKLILEISPKILLKTSITPDMIFKKLQSLGYKTEYLDKEKDYANIYAEPI